MKVRYTITIVHTEKDGLSVGEYEDVLKDPEEPLLESYPGDTKLEKIASCEKAHFLEDVSTWFAYYVPADSDKIMIHVEASE